jgi:hypothetical protein
MKKSTKADMGIRRRLYKLLRNGPQRCDRAAEGFEYGIVGINEGIISTEIAPFWRHQGKRYRLLEGPMRGRRRRGRA